MSQNTPADIRVIDEKGVPFNVTNEDEFGHGFAIFGCLILQLLNQKHKFQLLDFSYYVLNLYNFECKFSDTQETKIDEKLLMEKNFFILSASFQKNVHQECFALFENLCPIPILMNSSVAFKPPEID